MGNELLRKRLFEITAEKTSLNTYQSLSNMTFHDFPSFPLHVLNSCSQSLLKIICYLTYFPKLCCMKCKLVFIFFTGIKTGSLARLLFYTFYLSILLFDDFP